MLAKLTLQITRKKEFDFIKDLKKKFPNAELYLVGGMVRDSFLKRESKDFDFVVRNVPLKQLERILKTRGVVHLVGKTFGVLKFVPRGASALDPIDIALPRTDHAFGTGGYKDVDTQSDPSLPIEQDLLRRDFTVNALAWNVLEQKIVDPYHGVKHIKSKMLRTVGDPIERFHEDFTRMLRGIRFACQLNFNIERTALQAIKKLAHHLGEKREKTFLVPREMIAQEIIKAFVAQPVRAFDLLTLLNVFKILMPELLTMQGCEQPKNFHAEGDVWVHTRLALEKLLSPAYRKQFGANPLTAEILFGTLFHDLGKPYTMQTPEKDGTDRIRFNNHDSVGAEKAQAIMKRLSFSVFPKTDTLLHVDPDRVGWIIRNHLVGYRNDIDVMRESTVEQYFISSTQPSDSLIKVQYADTAATIHENGRADFSSFRKILKRVRVITKKSRNRKQAPPPLISGHDVMKIVKIQPGPRIGEILTLVRDQQLAGKIANKEQALTWLKKQKYHD
jgi:poly(A) polymerase